MEDRQVAVMLEKIHSDFRVFSEGLADVRQKVDETKVELRQEIRETNRRLDDVHQELRDTRQELTKVLNGILTILDRHDISIEDVEKRVARLEQRAG